VPATSRPRSAPVRQALAMRGSTLPTTVPNSAGHAITGMRHAQAKVAVVGQEQQAFALAIQPSDGIDVAPFGGEQVGDDVRDASSLFEQMKPRGLFKADGACAAGARDGRPRPAVGRRVTLVPSSRTVRPLTSTRRR